MSALRLELLGDLQIRGANGALATISAKKAQALLAYLAAKPAQRVSREKIAALLWSSTGPDQARQSLRQTLSMLRKELTTILGDARALLDDNDLLGVDETLVFCDVAEFESLAAAGSESALVTASSLYRGDLLDGFYLNEERFDQWVIAERDRLHRMSLRVHAQLVELQARRGAVDEAVGTAQKSLRIDPLQEPVHRTLMRLYLQSGDVVNALQQYESCARLLKRELRIEPDAETKALQREILQLRSRTPSVGAPAAEGDNRKTVLVVEDNVLSRELFNAVLKQAGYGVIGAKDGAEALMIIGREKIDLMLLDVDLPFIDGHHLLQAARENGVDVPAIFISGLPGEDIEVRAFEVGAADFIRKPVKNAVLLARVSKVLREG
ncbi:MAG TPA: BTAD domain-containing putative transcriptional regulator [Thermoanaerobaculia bacterium]|nr:BTAD domain-containing putative transcriptional regulator [Thermoanaerobaculia bacterium]